MEGLKAPMRSGAMTPNTSAATLWRNSVRTIGDILVLSDIINPHAYFALPFVNQAWFVAGCCYVKGRCSLLHLLQSKVPGADRRNRDARSQHEPTRKPSGIACDVSAPVRVDVHWHV